METLSFNVDSLFSLSSLSSTEGQWWHDRSFPGMERRTGLMAGSHNHWLWTTSIRDAATRRIIAHKFWASARNSREPLAVFDSVEQRHEWLERQWEAMEEADKLWAA